MTSALRYEWRRLVSLRSTWILLVVSVAFTALVAALQAAFSGLGGGVDGRVPIDEVVASAHNPVTVTLVSVVAAMAFGHEYRHGTIRFTLTALPRRGRVFAAKAIATAGFAASAHLLSMLAALIVALVAGTDRVRLRPLTARTRTSGDLDIGEWTSIFWQDLLRASAFVVGFALIALALTAILRNLALGVVIPLVASTLVEGLLMGFLETRVLWLNDLLPFTNGSMFLEWTPTGDPVTIGGDPADPMAVDYATVNPISPVRAGVVFGAWIAMLLAAAWALFERRDA